MEYGYAYYVYVVLGSWEYEGDQLEGVALDPFDAVALAQEAMGSKATPRPWATRPWATRPWGRPHYDTVRIERCKPNTRESKTYREWHYDGNLGEGDEEAGWSENLDV